MMSVRFPLSQRNVEDLLRERGIDISHESVRFWWNRFDPLFAAEIRRNANKQETGRWLNNRGENSRQPFRRRERAMLGFRSMRSLQKFTAVHSSGHSHFNLERHLYSRVNFKLNHTATLAEWRQLGVA